MSGAEIFGIVAAIPGLVANFLETYDKTVTTMARYKDRHWMVLNFRKESETIKQKILQGIQTLKIIAGYWEAMKKRKSDEQLIANGSKFRPSNSENELLEDEEQEKRAEDYESQFDGLQPFFDNLTRQLLGLRKDLNAWIEELEEYQVKFSSVTQNRIKRFLYGAKFATIGCEKLMMSHTKLQALSIACTADAMMLVGNSHFMAFIQTQEKDSMAITEYAAALRTILEMRRRVEKEGPDQIQAREIEVDQMGDYYEYEALQDEDVQHIGIRRPKGEGLAPEFERCVVDCRPWSWKHRDDILKDTQLIVRLLSEEVYVNPVTFEAGKGSLLKCKGYVERQDPLQRYELVFELPSGFDPNPRTLRSMLVEEARHPIKQRYELCLKLAGTLFILQTARYVHKAFRPDSVLMLQPAYVMSKDKYPHGLGEPFLLGWGDARSEDSSTRKLPASTKTRDKSYNWAYLHPRDVHEVRNDEYRTLDDIYSFGVSLVEIALWRSFFVWSTDEQRFVNDSKAVDLLVTMADTTIIHKDCEEMNRIFKGLAEKEVRITMGDTFSEIVMDCLTCFDKPFKFGSPHESKEGTVVSQKFMQLVVTKLRAVTDII